MASYAGGGEVVVLREHLEMINAYVAVRNRFCELLLTSPVNHEDTLKWLLSGNGEILCLREAEQFIGAVIIYFNRGGEIAIFVNTPGHGCGSILLKAIVDFAGRRGLKEVWAWVLLDNLPSCRLFDRFGFTAVGVQRREYDGREVQGMRYLLKIND